MKKIKLLVVDDSILFREVLTRYIREDSQIDVVGTAGDPYSARDMILKYEPDVMTLDIEMPRMDGVAFLKKLLPQYYLPVITVSSSNNMKQAALDAGCIRVYPETACPHHRRNAELRTDHLPCGKERIRSPRRPLKGRGTGSGTYQLLHDREAVSQK